MTGGMERDLPGFLDALGVDAEPMGMWYTDVEPKEGFAPEPLPLPDIVKEARNEIDWQALWNQWSCVLGHIWRARRRRLPPGPGGLRGKAHLQPPSNSPVFGNGPRSSHHGPARGSDRPILFMARLCSLDEQTTRPRSID